MDPGRHACATIFRPHLQHQTATRHCRLDQKYLDELTAAFQTLNFSRSNCSFQSLLFFSKFVFLALQGIDFKAIDLWIDAWTSASFCFRLKHIFSHHWIMHRF